MGFSKKEIWEEHIKHCNGVEDKPTRIGMLKESGKNLYLKNYQNQQKAPCVTYANFESLVQKIACIAGVERLPRRLQKNKGPEQQREQ